MRQNSSCRPGRLGRLGRHDGVRVHLAEREVAEHEAHARAQAAQHALHDRVRGAAVRALVVAVLDQRDGRRRVAERVVVGSDGRAQLAHRAPARELLERVEDAVGARVDADRRHVAPGDAPLGVDHEQRALAAAFRARGTRRTGARRRPWARSRRAAGSGACGPSRTRRGTRRRRPRCPGAARRRRANSLRISL